MTIKQSIIGSLMLARDTASIETSHMEAIHDQFQRIVSELNFMDVENATDSEKYIALHLIELGYMKQIRMGEDNVFWDAFVSTN